MYGNLKKKLIKRRMQRIERGKRILKEKTQVSNTIKRIL